MADSRKDFYKVLGVAETATPDEVKKAYRKLAKRYHPDATGGDKAKEAKFKEVSEAYETLGDEKKRVEYDEIRKSPFGASGFPGAGGASGFPGGGRVHIDLNDLFNQSRRGRREEAPQDSFRDIFSDLFSGMGFGAGTATREATREAQSAHSRDFLVETEVDLATAALGGDHSLMTPGGRITVKIPAGLEEGQTIRVAGKGRPARGGPGDLLIEVKIKPHPQFRRKGTDLEVDVPIQLDDAVLGAKVEVPTLEGKAQVTIPPGTSSGLKLRLKGKGIPQRSSSPEAAGSIPGARGDLYATVQIHVPKDIPPRARELIAEFAKLTRK